MRLRVYLSILFIIATTFTALHELEHIGSHDSAKCLVCQVNNHTSAPDVIKEFTEQVIYSYEKISTIVLEFFTLNKLTTNQANAPPKIS